MLNIFNSKKIPYKIHKVTSFFPPHYPDNILKDDPDNPNSRWTTNSDADQYIILEIPPSIVTSIKFGKFSKLHVCNVKYLKVYSKGDNRLYLNQNKNEEFYMNKSEDNEELYINSEQVSNKTIFNEFKLCKNNTEFDEIGYTEILRTTLTNDTKSETYNLKCINNNKFIISRYLKICPLGSWGMGNSYSFWYIEIKGIPINQQIVDWNRNLIDYKINRLIMKYFKYKGFSLNDNKLTGDNLNGDNLNSSNTNIALNDDNLNNNLNNNLNDNNLNDDNLIDNNLNDKKLNIALNQDIDALTGDNKLNNINLNIELTDQKNINIFNNKNILLKIKILLENEKYEEIIKIIENMSFEEYIENSEYTANIIKIENNNEKDLKIPKERAGHQLIPNNDELILYGGWNGIHELGDKWKFDVKNEKWTKIGEFEKRSCHVSFFMEDSDDGIKSDESINSDGEIKSYEEINSDDDKKSNESINSDEEINSGEKIKSDESINPVYCINSDEEIKSNENINSDKIISSNKIYDSDKSNCLDEQSHDNKNHNNKKTKNFYTIGRYILATENKNLEKINGNQFYKNHKKTKLKIKKFDEIYDHQIVIKNKKIYIIGGKFIKNNETYFNGILEINLKNNKIKELLNENDNNNVNFLGRSGHSVMYINSLNYNTYECIKRDKKRIFGECDEDEHEDNKSIIDNSMNNKSIIDNSMDNKSIIDNSMDNKSIINNSMDNKSIMDNKDNRSITDNNSTIDNRSLIDNKDIMNNKIKYPHELLYDFKDTIIIIGGKKHKEYHNEMIFYNIKYNKIYITMPLPITNYKYIQRSVLIYGEIFTIFFIDFDDGSILKMYNFSIKKQKWNKIKINGNIKSRSSFQLVYLGNLYLFGGVNRERLNDFYKIELKKLSNHEIKLKIKYIIYKFKIFKLMEKNKLEALNYLKSIKNYVTEDYYKKFCIDFVRNEYEYSEDLKESEINIKGNQRNINEGNQKNIEDDFKDNNINKNTRMSYNKMTINDVLKSISKYLTENDREPFDDLYDYVL